MRFLNRAKKPNKRSAKLAEGRSPKPRSRKRASARDTAMRRTVLLRGLRWGSAAAAVLLVVGGLGYAVQSGLVARTFDKTYQAAMAKTADLGLSVKEVYVVGRQETNQEDLLKALNIAVGDPILAIDTTAVQQRIEALGWVKSASVRRQLSGYVTLELVERKAIAIWQRGDRYSLIDADGVVIGDKDVNRHGHLKVVTGPDAPQHAAALMALLSSEPEIDSKVVAAQRVSDRRWNLMMEGGIGVTLPAENPDRAWHQLAEFQRDHEILSRAITHIDMRYPDRMAVEMTEPALEEVMGRRSGQDT